MVGPAPSPPPAALAIWGRSLLAEARSNRRAALGLAVAGLLLAAVGAGRLDDAVDAMRRSYLQQAQLLQRLAAAGGDWKDRAAASSATRRALEGRLWSAESEGVAGANLADWVSRAAHASGLTELQVKVELAALKDLPANRRQLTATITALQTEPAMIAFLEQIEQEPRLLVVERLHVVEQPLPRLEMTLLAQAELASPGRGDGQ
jgi:hypothetical protein